MNKIGVLELTETAKSLKDGFNYPMPNRDMLMSLNTITTINDFVNTTTMRFQTHRRNSQNLSARDIEGKYKLISDDQCRRLTENFRKGVLH